MRSADLNEMILSGELAGLTSHMPGSFPDPAAAAPHAANPATAGPSGHAHVGGQQQAPPTAGRGGRKRLASPTGLPRSSLDALMAPSLALDLHGLGDGAKRARRSGERGPWVCCR